MCICCTLFPGELIKIRVRRALNVAAFCQNKQKLLVIGFTLREVFKTTPITKASCRRRRRFSFSFPVGFYWPVFRPGDGFVGRFCLSTSGSGGYYGATCQWEEGQRRLSPQGLEALKCTIKEPISHFHPDTPEPSADPVELNLEGRGWGWVDRESPSPLERAVLLTLQQMFLQSHCV